MIKKYKTYKDSGVEWIGKIPIDWTLVKLKFLMEIKSGKSISTELLSDEYDIPVLGGNGILGKTNNYNSESKDIIIGRVGAHCGNIHLLNGKKWVTDNALLVKSKINEEFLTYWLKSLKLNRLANTNAQPLLTGSLIKNQFITIPTDSQVFTQIANYLDYKTNLIDSIIAQKEELIEKLKEQRQAIINEAVTKGLNPNVPLRAYGIEWLGDIPEHWKVVKFRYKFETSKGLTITKANLVDEGIPVVNYGEIHSKFGFEVNPEIHNLKCVIEDYIESNESSLLSKGDFVFADTSEDIEGSGNFTHLNSDIPTFAGYHTIIARLIDNSDYRYFAYFFDSTTYRTQIQNLVKGVKVYSITNKILKDTILFYPPVDEQKNISEYIDFKVNKIFSSIEKLEKSIKKLKEYRQSIISEAVTGKIDVRDWKPKTA
ncbi:restriction endonuclease subunit S [Flaviramulus aquimarinus]|uniref:Restriction endonuclease subunit S n=1 Tax=Flaviramulus aquimarinus TaxID=1170456 RepID=A0ABP9F0T4_9FLAO